MLELRNIIKDYKTGDTSVRALNGISLQFRKNEFVSILGPSGCGKTTLLNIIGGLDQYTSGDLVINGVSTKSYKDADWDTYRNHSIGFVFQSYNLIPHQTVLANVELALTLSGISKKDRRARAVRALRDVGLADQIHKKPNQLSGGQMQRVAIARALVNDPDILLADEPTGALDTQTSVQIMDILRSISKRKLIIMVTHNPDLAKEYSSRIISVLDGRVVEDTNPYRDNLAYASRFPTSSKKRRGLRSAFSISRDEAEKYQLGGAGYELAKKEKVKKKKKKSMSFFTALSLSLNNLMTKKARTFMTSFAGSIGIIGIALILSVSMGVNSYINDVQRETLSGYPLELHAQTMDLGSVLTTLMDEDQDDAYEHDRDKIYESVALAQLVNVLSSAGTTTNDLVSFKQHLESSEEFKDYLSAVQYAYDFNWSVFVREGEATNPDSTAPVIKSDMMGWMGAGADSLMGGSSMGGISSLMSSSMLDVWSEMLAPLDSNSETLVNDVLKEQYEFVDEGSRWPTAANEVVLVVSSNNEISDLSLYALGLRTKAEMMAGWTAAMEGTTVDLSERKSWTFEEIRSMEYRLILASECYAYDEATGTYTDLSATAEGREQLYEDENVGFTLKVVGIVRPREGVTSTTMTTGTIGYTSALAAEALERTKSCDLLNLQKQNSTTDILTGKLFDTGAAVTKEQMKAVLARYLSTMSESEAQDFIITAFLDQTQVDAAAAELAQLPDAQLSAMLLMALDQLPAENLPEGIPNEVLVQQILASEDLKKETLTLLATSSVKQQLIPTVFTDSKTALDVLDELTEAQISLLYTTDGVPRDFSDSSYENNLFLLGDVKENSPASIYLYAETFEDKDAIGALISDYNDSVNDLKKIEYTDYVALLMSSITMVLNAITYVLVAFVAISLVVSSIMIGIITYISVLERTKEIGILRAIGASKRDVSRVFNAETLIVGFVAGALGIGITLGLNVVINIILLNLTGIPNLKASLPVAGAVILVLISMLLTFIAGLFPARFAAKRNPVEALRSE